MSACWILHNVYEGSTLWTYPQTDEFGSKMMVEVCSSVTIFLLSSIYGRQFFFQLIVDISKTLICKTIDQVRIIVQSKRIE